MRRAESHENKILKNEISYGIAPKFGVLIGGLLAMILGAADKYLLFEHSKAGFDRSVIRIAQIKDIPFSCDFYFY
jgi:hypothetical protein